MLDGFGNCRGHLHLQDGSNKREYSGRLTFLSGGHRRSETTMGLSGISDRIKIRDQRVEVRGGGGCLSIVGIVFVLMGGTPIGLIIAGVGVL